MSFLETIREHDKEIIETAFRRCLDIPKIFNKTDNRMLLGRMMEQSICECIPGLEHNPNKGFDALYFSHQTSHGSEPERISIKTTRSSNFFSRPRRRGVGWTTPGKIVVTNKLSRKSDADNKYQFEYLFAIQALLEEERGVVWGGCAVTTPAVVRASLVKAGNDQTAVCILGDDWLYRSKLYEMEITPEIQSDLERLNEESPEIVSEKLTDMQSIFSGYLNTLPEMSEIQDPSTLYEEELV